MGDGKFAGEVAGKLTIYLYTVKAKPRRASQENGYMCRPDFHTGSRHIRIYV